MKKLIALLALLPALAFAQIYSPPSTIPVPLPVASGGTNCTSASGTCLDNVTGFSSTGFVNRTGAGAYSFTASTGSGSVVLGTSPTLTTPNIGAATGTSVTLSGLTANSFLYSGTSGLLTTTAAPTNGQLLIGSTGAAPVKATLTGASNQVSVTNGAGSITLGLPSTLTIPGTISSYNSITTAGAGACVIVADTHNTYINEAAVIGPVTVYAVPSGQDGRYIASMTTGVTQAATTSSTLPNTTVSATDSFTGATVSASLGATSTGNSLSTWGQGNAQLQAKGGTNITAQTNSYASSGATPMQYYVRYLVQYCGN